MIKIGLIGTGFMGGTHLAAYRQLLHKGGFCVAAVADLDQEKAAKAAQGLGAKVYANGEQLLAEADINTVDICLPTDLHYQYALAAIERGYNIFVEKPLCRTSEQARRLADAARAKGVTAMVGQCIRFWDEYVYLKDLVDKKTYGYVVSAHFRRLSPRPTWGWQNWLMDNERSGGAALDLHIHDTDYAIHTFGEPAAVKTVTNTRGEKHSYINTLYSYPDFLVTVEGSWNFPAEYPFEMYYRVVFERAVIEFSSARGIKGYNDGGAFEPKVPKQCVAQSEGLGGNISDLGGYYNELDYFIDCLINGMPAARASLDDGAKSVAMIERELGSIL